MTDKQIENQTEKRIVLDKDSIQPVVDQLTAGLVKGLISARKIRLDSAQMADFAKAASKHINIEIDYEVIARRAAALMVQPKDGRDGKDLLLTEAIRTDVINSVAGLVPNPKDGKPGLNGMPGEKGKEGSNYILTNQDKLNFVNQTLAKANFEERIDQAVGEAISELDLVSGSRFRKRLLELAELVKKSGVKIINAGISGQDMIDDISKILGEDWKTGGSGITDLKVEEITKDSSVGALDSDMQKIIRYANGASPFTYTIPLQSTENIVNTSWLRIYRSGTGEISIVREGGVTFEGVLGNVNFKLDENFEVYMIKRLPNIWRYIGGFKSF